MTKEEIKKKCSWDIGNEPVPGDPRNKDFFEADAEKIKKLIEENSKLTGERFQIKQGWSDSGRVGRIVSEPVTHDGIEWIGVIFDDDDTEEGLAWYKTSSIKLLNWERMHGS